MRKRAGEGGLGVWCRGGDGKVIFVCGVIGKGFIIKATFEGRPEESEAKFKFYSWRE